MNVEKKYGYGVFGDENGTVWDVEIKGERMEWVHKFKCLNERGIEKVVSKNKVTNERRVSGAIKALVNEKLLSLKRLKICWIWFLMYGSRNIV